MPALGLQGQVKWAMAGRNRQRLEELRLELSKTYGEDLKVRGVCCLYCSLSFVHVCFHFQHTYAVCTASSQSGRERWDV